MKTLILDGSAGLDAAAGHLRTMLADELRARRADVEHMTLSEKKIAPCQGDFYCWVRTPGMCIINDNNRAIARSMANCDLLVFLTPITFGGYSSHLKQAVDHLIQNVSPSFSTIHCEVHHARRYPRYPRLRVIGWAPTPDSASEATFRCLVYRNALNFHAPAAVCGILSADSREADIHAAIQGWVDEVLASDRLAEAPLPASDPAVLSACPAPQRALLLVGSPRKDKSSSHALGAYLFEQLAAQGIQTETLFVYQELRSEEGRQRMYAAAAAAGLVALASPLYVDSLPAPVMRTLEAIAARRVDTAPQHPPRFTALLNCGFPEAAHNLTALAICRNFARQAGFEWAGGLALGGGIVHGQPLNELDGRAIPLKRSLGLTAQALAAGQAIPAEAGDLLAKPVIPAWLYRLSGGFGWRQQAKKHGAQRQIAARPYIKG